MAEVITMRLPLAGEFVLALRFACDSRVAIFERTFSRLRATGIAELVRTRSS